MTSTTPPSTGVLSSSLPGRIASVRHSVIVVGVLLTLAALGALAQARNTGGGAALAQPRKVIPLYLSLIAAEWGLFYLVLSGLHSGTKSWRDLIGGQWISRYHAFRDLLLALAFWALWAAVATLVKSWLAPDTAKSISTLLPHTPADVLIWIALSMSAGFCEEFVYRGYLQQQFEALTGSPFWALLLQALLFGVSHGYQGARQVAVISVYGLLFGLLARWRRSLRPGMMAHAWTDIAGGIVFPSA